MRVHVSATKAFMQIGDVHVDIVKGSSRFGRARIVEDFEEELKRSEAYEIAKRKVRESLRRLYRDRVETRDGGTGTGEKRLWKMNRTEVMRRGHAYAGLRSSKSFLAFYTASFPAGMPERVIVQVWNTILTRWRQELGLKSYLWVAERQKNGTRHYHMLTNCWMPISRANEIAAIAIDTFVRRGLCSWGNSSLQKYNGIDVKRVKGDPRLKGRARMLDAQNRTVGYLVKYMGKGTAESEFRLWHCSRMVSALFVSMTVSEDQFTAIAEDLGEEWSKVKIYQCEYGTLYVGPFRNSNEYSVVMDRVNDCVEYFFEEEAKRGHSCF